MATDLYWKNRIGRGGIAGLAKATRSLVDLSENEEFDVIRFLEVDIIKIVPEFYLYIEDDAEMGGVKAFTTPDSKGIVVAESVYNDACHGYFYARKILAHEFGHVLLHHEIENTAKHFEFACYDKQNKHMNPNDSAESQAEIFGILLLIPEQFVCNGKIDERFKKKNRISERMADYVARKISSLKKSGKYFDQAETQKVIDSLVNRSSGSAKENLHKCAQLSLF